MKNLIDKIKKLFSNNYSETESNHNNEAILEPQTFDEKVSAVDQLFYRAQYYEYSEEYMKAFKFIKKMRNIAPFNAWLLYQQNPDVTYAATANDWAQKFNRAIKPNSRAYVILQAFGPVSFVYDVKDTVGEELPKDIQAPFRAEGVLPQQALDQILKCCIKKRINISYDMSLPERLAGWASHKELEAKKSIIINADHTPEVQFSTLIHELAHLMLGHLGKFEHCECENRWGVLCENAREIEAETVSWLICERLNIKTNADRYLNNHIKNKDALSEISLHKILTTADRIENIIVSGQCNKDKKKIK